MNQNIIYNSTGDIIDIIMTTSQTGMGAVSSIEYDISDGYTVSSVNTETGEPVFEPIPKTEDQLRLEALERQMNALLGVSE